MIEEFVSRVQPLYRDRRAAGLELAVALRRRHARETVVVGLARGGLEVAGVVARVLQVPLDVVAVRKVAAPGSPEYGLGAVAPDGSAFVRPTGGLDDALLAGALERARREAIALDRRLHALYPPLALVGKDVVVVDDGVATGGTMIAALRWARAAGARTVVAAVPVAALESLESLLGEADDVVCPHPVSPFVALGRWYASFDPVDEAAVVRMLAAGREPAAA